MSTRSSAAVLPVTVEADLRSRTLCVRFFGDVKPAQLAERLTDVDALVATLGRGFTLLTDLTGLESMDLDCGRHVSQMMDLCVAGGIGKVVRIIPDPRKDIGFNLLGVLHYRGRVPAVTCKTREEAERELARARSSS